MTENDKKVGIVHLLHLVKLSPNTKASHKGVVGVQQEEFGDDRFKVHITYEGGGVVTVEYAKPHLAGMTAIEYVIARLAEAYYDEKDKR